MSWCWYLLVAALSITVVSDALQLDSQESVALPLYHTQYLPLAANNPYMKNGLLFKRQGIIPGPRVGRSFPFPSPYGGLTLVMPVTRDDASNRMHDMSLWPSASSQPHGRMRRSLPNANANYDDNGGSGNDEESSKIVGMSLFHRNQRQLIPAPRVGRSEPAQAKTGLITGFNQASASGPFDGEDDLMDSASPAADRAYRLFAKAYLSSKGAKDMLKRVALTPRIGRSDGYFTNSWLDDSDYYARIAKAPLTPRIGRSVANSEERTSDSNKS